MEKKAERVTEQVIHTFYSDSRFVLKVVRWGDSPALLVKQKFVEGEEGEKRTRTAALNLKDIEIVVKSVDMLRNLMKREQNVQHAKTEKYDLADRDTDPGEKTTKSAVEKPTPPPARKIRGGSDKPE